MTEQDQDLNDGYDFAQLTKEEADLIFQGGVMVGLMRLYDAFLVLITEIRGDEEIAKKLIAKHARGEYLYPTPLREDDEAS